MTSRLYPTICGRWCDDCNHFEVECQGCSETEGSSFWTEFQDVDACPVFLCVREKGLAHCGFCDEMPCERYTRFHDPDMNNEEIIAALANQKAELIRRKPESDKK
jgi:hypothetical protein